MNIIIIGPPGSGKGTQGDTISKNFKLFKISTGELLREEINKKSSLGNQIKTIIDKGLLVSDDIINNLIEIIISNKNYSNRLIFDGYPRNLNQAQKLDDLINKYNQKISCVISLKVEEKTVIKRILGRQICLKCGLTFNEFFKPSTKENHNCEIKFLQKRSDDNQETLKMRFETYNKETMPILKHYQNQRLLREIDGVGDIHEIYSKIQQIIQSLET